MNRANKFIEEKAPCKLSKENKIEELKDVIYSLLESLRLVGAFLYPFMPKTSIKILESLNVAFDPAKTDFEKFVTDFLKPDTKLKKIPPLFTRIKV